MAIAPKNELGTPFGQAQPKTTPKATPKAPTAESAANAAVAKANADVAKALGGGSTFTYGAGNPSFITSLQQVVSDANVAKGLNPDGSKKTNTQIFQEGIAARDAARKELESKDPIYNKAGGAPAAPPGFRYTWIGGTSTGKWTLYSVSTGGGGGGGGGGNGDGTGGTDGSSIGAPTTSVEVLKALLKGQGFSSAIIDSSASYLTALLKENIDYDNAVEIFLNTKEYTLKNGTKLTSPFYTAYGYLNEGLTVPKKASELFNAVEGYKSLQQKYGFSDKYLAPDSLKNYVKNNVTVADLDERANAARLAALTSDPAKTDAFIKLGYIASKEGLQDFFMDSKIGKEQLELNRNTGAFVAEAIRRNRSGILTNEAGLSDFRKISASLTEKGYSEAQIANLAATGFENISQKLQPTIALSGIYEKTPGTEATLSTIQSELAQEEFMNLASQRRKKLEEQNIRAFQGTAGTTTSSLRTSAIGGQV
jgi:hypothetical protein